MKQDAHYWLYLTDHLQPVYNSEQIEAKKQNKAKKNKTKQFKFKTSLFTGINIYLCFIFLICNQIYSNFL